MNSIAKSLLVKVDRQISVSNLPRIDEALRNDFPLKMSGIEYDLNEYSDIINATVQDPINRLIEGLKGMQDRIELIGVVGGHPELYRNELAKRFPNVPVFVSPASLFANLRGFQAVANEILIRDEKIAA